MVKDSKVRLQDGKVIDVAEGGDPRGHPVFVFHGSPGSRVLYRHHVEDAQRKGVRLIGFSRPGYGGSTRELGRTVADGVDQLSSLADSLGIERFGVWGHSGGGKYALASAALIPRRLVGASCLSALAPVGSEGLDWFAGMGKSNEDDFKLMTSDRKAWEKASEEQAKMMVAGAPTRENVIMALGTLLSDVDRSMLTDDMVEFLTASTREGLKNGAGGWIDDALAEASPWGFELASVRSPTQVWHGRHDGFCPYAHGEWLARHVPNAEVHLEQGAGHLSMYERKIPEVHDWLVERF